MYTIILSALDNGEQVAYGNFRTLEAAEKRRERMERDLDGERDASGLASCELQVVHIQPLWTWETDNAR